VLAFVLQTLLRAVRVVNDPVENGVGDDPHVFESGSPRARYAVLTIIGEQVSAEMTASPYDWEAASACAEANGRPEWVYGLGGSCWVLDDGVGHNPQQRTRQCCPAQAPW
jgi:hypothetical protein